MNFFKKTSAKESVREQKKSIRKEGRGLDREERNLEREKKKIEDEIKRAARNGDMALAKRLAKNLVQMKKTRTQLAKMKGNMKAMEHKTTSMSANLTMAKAVKNSGDIMQQMNAQIDPATMTKIMQDFEKQNAKMSMSEEMMDDVVDGLFGSEDEEEVDEAVDAVLDEIGLHLKGDLADIKTGNKELSADEEAEDLINRLAQLKNS